MTSDDRSPARPRYLVFALVVAWFVGLRSAHEGYVVASIARDPLAGDMLTVPPELRDAMVMTIVDHASVALPLSLAQALLGAVLVVVSAVALFRGRLNPSFYLQILVANAAVAVLAHVLGAPVRETVIAVLSRSPELVGVDTSGMNREDFAATFRWAFHMGLAVQLAILGGLGLAFTRRTARAFLSRGARAPEEG